MTMTIGEARRHKWPEIEVGNTYTFHSTTWLMQEVAEHSGQECKVIRPLRGGGDEVDDEVGPMYEVEFKDGFRCHVNGDEITGFMFKTEQTIEFWPAECKQTNENGEHL